MQDSFKTRARLKVGSANYNYFSLKALEKKFPRVGKLPFSLRILLENLLRHEDGRTVTKEDIEALATRDVRKPTDREIAFRPARVLLQDFTGVPAVVDLAAMREALAAMGGNPEKINPLAPADLVIDHSVIVDQFATSQAFGAQREARVRPQPRALRVPALGPERVPQLPRRAARTRASATR